MQSTFMYLEALLVPGGSATCVVRFGTCLGPSPLKHNVAIRLMGVDQRGVDWIEMSVGDADIEPLAGEHFVRPE
jgi:hypothetical protein